MSLVESTRELPHSLPHDWNTADYLGNGHFALDYAVHSRLAFLHIPSIKSQKPVEDWSIPPFSFDILGYAVHPPENVLAVAEWRRGLVSRGTSSFEDSATDRAGS